MKKKRTRREKFLAGVERVVPWARLIAPHRRGRLTAHRDWLAERFRQHRGNCDVVRQELQREHGVTVSLRTVERAVAHLRREVLAQTAATVRFETLPGHQVQIDFGTVRVPIADEQLKVHLFVATLGYSRRIYVAMFLHERQSAWLQGLEGAFRHFGGTPREVLGDSARALVNEHDAQTREVVFNDRFHAFCRYWGVIPRACAPYRARTKGKDERGVGYVKRNAIAGHRFASLEELQAHLARWMREVADVRVHGTTAEPPIDRFERDERRTLTLLAGIVGAHLVGVSWLARSNGAAASPPAAPAAPAELLRPLAEYETALGGGW